MKKKVLFSILALILAFPLVFSAPATACIIPDTSLEVSVSATGTPGNPVVLTVYETNNSTTLDGLYLSYITIEHNGVTDTFDRFSPRFKGGDTGPAWYILEAGETWVWEVTYYPMVTTTYTITGHGFLFGGIDGDGKFIPGEDITWPKYAGERKIVTVTMEENGLEGLTPGFWKNHVAEWANTAYSPSQTFNSVFGVGPGITLLEAVGAKGGGEKALLRHAVAAILNASHPAIDYPLTTAQIIAAVQNAYATGNFETAKNLLEGYNQLEIELGYNSPNVHKKPKK